MALTEMVRLLDALAKAAGAIGRAPLGQTASHLISPPPAVGPRTAPMVLEGLGPHNAKAYTRMLAAAAVPSPSQALDLEALTHRMASAVQEALGRTMQQSRAVPISARQPAEPPPPGPAPMPGPAIVPHVIAARSVAGPLPSGPPDRPGTRLTHPATMASPSRPYQATPQPTVAPPPARATAEPATQPRINLRWGTIAQRTIATANQGAGSAATAQLTNLAAAAGRAATLLGGPAGVGVVAASLAYSLAKLPSTVVAWSTALIESQRQLRLYSATLNRTFAQMEYHERLLSARTAAGTAGTTALLGQQLMALRSEVQPLRELLINVRNLAAAFVVFSTRLLTLAAKATLFYQAYINLNPLLRAALDRLMGTAPGPGSDWLEHMRAIASGTWDDDARKPKGKAPKNKKP